MNPAKRDQVTLQVLKTERKNLGSILKVNCDDNDQDLPNRINETYIRIMNSYSALPEDLCFRNDKDECIQVTVDSMTEKLRQIDKSKASGPDNLPSWLLKTYADIIALAITDVLNSSFLEGKVPSMRKLASIAPLVRSIWSITILWLQSSITMILNQQF